MSTNKDSLWENDFMQFSRLLAEIAATVELTDAQVTEGVFVYIGTPQRNQFADVPELHSPNGSVTNQRTSFLCRHVSLN
jgi:hypothetical protein